MRIGQMARRTGISVRMLRYYEEQGFLTPNRAKSGYRVYGPVEQMAIDRIIVLQKGGLTLETIRKIMPCVINSGPVFEPCHELKSILLEQMRNLNERIATLEQSREVLSNFFHGVEGGTDLSAGAALQNPSPKHRSSLELAKPRKAVLKISHSVKRGSARS